VKAFACGKYFLFMSEEVDLLDMPFVSSFQDMLFIYDSFIILIKALSIEIK